MKPYFLVVQKVAIPVGLEGEALGDGVGLSAAGPVPFKCRQLVFKNIYTACCMSYSFKSSNVIRYDHIYFLIMLYKTIFRKKIRI